MSTDSRVLLAEGMGLPNGVIDGLPPKFKHRVPRIGLIGFSIQRTNHPPEEPARPSKDSTNDRQDLAFALFACSRTSRHASNQASLWVAIRLPSQFCLLMAACSSGVTQLRPSLCPQEIHFLIQRGRLPPTGHCGQLGQQQSHIPPNPRCANPILAYTQAPL